VKPVPPRLLFFEFKILSISSFDKLLHCVRPGALLLIYYGSLSSQVLLPFPQIE
jgi:hypothetical protein